ncbi:hypothetical protein BpHYR1_046015, partial [Brachionus plicatilis]
MLKNLILTFLIAVSLAQDCPPGVPVARCRADPCKFAIETGCAAFPQALCRPNYCGGCNSEWFLDG